MKNFRAQVRIRFKDGILDPQAEVIQKALESLDFKTVQEVCCEKVFVLGLLAENEEHARIQAREMSEKLLSNVVMEDFEVEISTP